MTGIRQYKKSKKTTNVWQLIKQNKNKDRTFNILTLNDNGRKIPKAEEKLNVVAQHYERINNLTRNESDLTTTQQVNTTVIQIITSIHTLPEEDLTSPAKIKWIIGKTNKTKAKGEDSIQFKALNMLQEKMIVQLHHITTA